MTTSASKNMDIEVLATPRSITVMIDGDNVIVTPASVSHLGEMLRDGKAAFSALEDGQALAALFVDHTDALIAICASGTDISRQAVGELQGDEFMALLGAVLEVNADFFTHRLRPAMETMMHRLTSVLEVADSLPGSND